MSNFCSSTHFFLCRKGSVVQAASHTWLHLSSDGRSTWSSSFALKNHQPRSGSNPESRTRKQPDTQLLLPFIEDALFLATLINDCLKTVQEIGKESFASGWVETTSVSLSIFHFYESVIESLHFILGSWADDFFSSTIRLRRKQFTT